MNAWAQNKDLVREGWHFLAVLASEIATPQYRQSLLDRFREAIFVKSPNQKNYLELYVMAYPEIPEDQDPGGGFIQMGCRRPNEPADKNYISRLEQEYRQLTGKDSSSMLITPGPFYIRYSVVKGQFERITAYDRIIWMR
ncbi:hypothetical protein HYU11_02815 [Candidatus Woesearchaeota archaeon]|nr:hypothetical protein [Candidatus Woesearchaeota archaeon]